MSADPEPVKDDDGESVAFRCPECGTQCWSERKARAHCSDSETNGQAEVEAEAEPEPESGGGETSLSTDDVREHHGRIEETVAPLGELGGNPTLLVNDKKGWYVTRDNTDPSEDEIGEFPKERRARNFTTDYADVVDGPLERTLYALTSYKVPSAFEHWVPARFDEDAGVYEYKTKKPSPAIEDTAAISAWGDIDLEDDLKLQRPHLDAETYETAETAIEAYIDAFADLYGDRDAVYALDSVGGAYVFGAPEATLPISRYYQDDAEARSRALSAFIERTNEYLQQAEERVNERVEGAAEAIHPDWANNINRQYKIPMTLHGDHDAVVTPLDVEDVRYREPLAFGDVDEDHLSEAREWCESFTAVEHTECVESLVATLWPNEYEEHGSWDAALDAWVESQREEERRAEQRRQAAAERREERMEELGGLEGQPITPFMQDIYDALDEIDTADVVRKYASNRWDTGTDASGKTEFDPSWRESSSGSSCYVDHNENRFGDPGASGGGYAAKAMALGRRIITAASDDLNGRQWGEAVDELRDVGYDVPLWTPEKGSKRRDGSEYEQMPFWAVRKAAVALGVLPEHGFVQKTSDDGGTYPGFPGPETYNSALDAIEEAGLEHGRERADPQPTHFSYQLAENADDAPDLELQLVPITGKKVQVMVEQDGERAYKETLDRGFWSNGTKRSRVAGRVKSTIDTVEPDILSESVKDALTQADLKSDTDEFEETMRSPREQELRDRTLSVVCWPGEEDTEWTVLISPPSDSPEQEPQRFTFDSGQIHNADPGYFQSKHIAAFFEKIDLDNEEWANLTSYWLDVQETRDREADPRKETAVEQFMSKIEVMTVWADEEGFNWGGRNGLYRREYDRDQDAILVPGRWVTEWLTDSDYSDMNFSKILRERGLMIGAAKRMRIVGKQNRAWPINADETDHTYENSHRPRSEEDDNDVEGLR